MESLKRVIGIVLIVIALIVAIQTIIEPIYHTSTDESPHSSAWDIINPLSAISIILGLIFGYIRMRGIGEDSSVQEFIAANTLFYGFIFTAIIFLLELVRYHGGRVGLHACRHGHPKFSMDSL